jgi:hypothetical protein
MNINIFLYIFNQNCFSRSETTIIPGYHRHVWRFVYGLELLSTTGDLYSRVVGFILGNRHLVDHQMLRRFFEPVVSCCHQHLGLCLAGCCWGGQANNNVEFPFLSIYLSISMELGAIGLMTPLRYLHTHHPGDGNKASFWNSGGLQGSRPKDVAPLLSAHTRKKKRSRQPSTAIIGSETSNSTRVSPQSTSFNLPRYGT